MPKVRPVIGPEPGNQSELLHAHHIPISNAFSFLSSVLPFDCLNTVSASIPEQRQPEKHRQK
jgi:hypothetical protein